MPPDPELSQQLARSIQRDPTTRLAMKLTYYRRHIEQFFIDQLRIRTKEGTVQPLTLWPCQKPVLDAMLQQLKETGWIRMVVLKARQVGMSTMSEALMTHRVMLYPNTNGLVIAHDSATAETLFSISKTFYDHIDADLRPLKRYSTKREFVFENPDDDTRPLNPGLGSRMVITSANNIHSGIGRTLRAVHISEAARFKDPKAIVDGIFPALAKKPGTICVIESTAQFSGQWFKEMTERAAAREGDFWFVFVPWFLQPDYYVPLLPGEDLELSFEERRWIKDYGLALEQIKFFRQELANSGDENLFLQSYPFTPEQAWITPGANVFPYDRLDEQRRENITPPMRTADVIPEHRVRIQDHPEGRLWIWEDPKKGTEYDGGVDVALGVDESDDTPSDHDWSVIEILERGTNRQVAEWRSRSVDAVAMAKVCYWLGAYYNWAQMCIEVNGIGISTNLELGKLGYPNIYIWRYRDERGGVRMSKKVGWETSPRTKRMLVSFAVHNLVNRNVVIRSSVLLDEMWKFVRMGEYDAFGGAAGAHDDCVMAWMIGLTCSDDENFKKFIGMESTREIKATQNDPRVLLGEKSPSGVVYESWNSDTDFLKVTPERDFDPWD